MLRFARIKGCPLPRPSRRRLLQLGALSSLGLTLPRLLYADESRGYVPQADLNSTTKAARLKATARSCILFFMEGGPSHVDLWDMKPQAPEQVRGIFKPIATSLPGMHVCEHLPQWARLMNRMAVVRSVSHGIVDHNASSYFSLTGQSPLRDGQLIRGPSGENAPPIGSVLAKLRPSGQPLPDYVHIPRRMFNCGHFIPGVLAGFLGDAYDPFIAGDPSKRDYHVPGLERRLSDNRFERRRSLLEQVDRRADTADVNRAFERLDTFYEKAYSLIASPKARRAFRLDEEPQQLRDRYGYGADTGKYRGNGLPHLGQSFLLARRLVEAGVRLVSVWAGSQAFDTHREHFDSLQYALCPPIDQAFSALIEDLDERGMLDETLVVALGEFGRTPKLGQVTSSAGATPDGRDHWPHCYTVLLAGGGVQPGMIYGASDRFAAYPAADPVAPRDMAATIYTLLGIDPSTRLYDRIGRPHTLADGEPIAELLT